MDNQRDGRGQAAKTMNKILDFFRLIYYFPRSIKREYNWWRFRRWCDNAFGPVAASTEPQRYLAHYYENDALPAFVIKAPKWRLAPYLHRLFDFGAKVADLFSRGKR